MREYIFDVPDSNQPISGDTSLYYPDERDEPMMVCEEIVRCRDCKHMFHCWHHDDERWQCAHEMLDGLDVSPSFFCAWAERRGQ